MMAKRLSAQWAAQQMERLEARPKREGVTRNNITVIRVETPNGTGAYRHGFAADTAMRGEYHHNPDDLGRHETHPDPYMESFSEEWKVLQRHRDNKNWYFAFANVAQLLEWWNTPEALKLLENADLHGVEYECEPGTVIAGEKQVIFRRRMARKGRAHRLSSLVDQIPAREPVEAGAYTAIEMRAIAALLPAPPITDRWTASDIARLQQSPAKFGRYSATDMEKLLNIPIISLKPP